MNRRFIAVLVFALAVSAVASTVVYQLIAGRISTQAKQTTARVVVATRDLAVGTLLKPTDLRVADWSGEVSPQWVLKPEDAVGRGVIANIYKDEPVANNRLAPAGAGAGLAASIPPGMRAVAVKVNEVVGLAGYVLPGMRVDVIAAATPPDETRALGTLAKTILQNIEVLSAGQNLEKDTEGKPVNVQVVNLLVTPEQAEILSLAANEAKIQLVLRNPLDTQEAKVPGTATALLFRDKPTNLSNMLAPVRRPAAARAPAPAAKAAEKEVKTETVVVPVMMEIIHGNKKDEAKVGQRTEQRLKETSK
jgi:pilus assembly protein CpaB